MSKEDLILQDEETLDYLTRTDNRTATLGASTMALLKSFIEDGDDYTTAKGKVKELSQEISANSPASKMDYILGDAAELVATVQASVLVHMSQAKKDIVINILNLQS